MALSANFSYSNTTASSKSVTPVDIKPVTNYGLTCDEPTRVSMSNKTTQIDQPEIITFQADRVNSVSSVINNPNPPKNSSAIRYGVRVDELLRVTSSENDDYAVDYPIVMNLTVKHAAYNLITAEMVEQVFKRLLGMIIKEDGTTRFNELMRQSLKPTSN